MTPTKLPSEFKPVVRNINNQDIYFYNGNNNFTNIRTGVSGTVTDNAAAKTFKLNLEISILLNEFPLVADFIKRMDLKTFTDKI